MARSGHAHYLSLTLAKSLEQKLDHAVEALEIYSNASQVRLLGAQPNTAAIALAEIAAVQEGRVG